MKIKPYRSPTSIVAASLLSIIGPGLHAQDGHSTWVTSADSTFQAGASAEVFIDKNRNKKQDEGEFSVQSSEFINDRWEAGDGSLDPEQFEDYKNRSETIPLQTATLDGYTNTARASATHDVEFKFSEVGDFLGIEGRLAGMVEDMDEYTRDEHTGQSSGGIGRAWVTFRAQFVVEGPPVPVSLTGTVRAVGPSHDRVSVEGAISLIGGSIDFQQGFSNNNPGDEPISFNQQIQELSSGSYVFTVEAIVNQINFDEGNGLSEAEVEFELSLDATPSTPVETYEGIQWNNAAGGSFAEASNWDPEQVPGIDDTAVFGLPGSYFVDAFVGENTRLIEKLFIGGDPAASVTFRNTNLSANATSLQNPGILVNNGTFTLRSGTLSSNHAAIGTSSATNVFVASFPVDSFWNTTGRLTIGGGGEANFEILGGGKVNSGESILGAAADGVAIGKAVVTGDGSEWDAGALKVGEKSPGELSVLNGGKVTASTVLVGESQTTGEVKIMGSDTITEKASLLLLSEDLVVGSGNNGTGNLVLQTGGIVTINNGAAYVGNGGTGSISVSGKHAVTGLPSVFSAQAALFIGFISSGTMTVMEEASVLAGDTLIGEYGKVTVKDRGSSWIHTGSLGLSSGANGTAELEVLQGGRVAAPEINLEGSLIVSGRVMDQSSAFISSGALNISIEDNDQSGIVVDGGAILEAAHITISHGNASSALIQIVGVGSDGFPTTLRQTGTSSFFVGDNGGVASLSILDGALAEISAQLIIGLLEGQGELVVSGANEASGTRSSVIVDGETLTVGLGEDESTVALADGGLLDCRNLVLFQSGKAEISGSSEGSESHLKIQDSLTLLDGTLTLDNTGAVTIGAIEPKGGKLRLGSGGELSGVGAIIADKENNGGVDSFSGSITSPGSSPGKLTIDGHFTAEPGSILLLEVAGTEAGTQYDQLVITGDVNFRGTIILKFLENFAPSAGENFLFIEAQGNSVVDIEEILVANLEPGFEFNVATTDGKTTLTSESNAVYTSSPPASFAPGLTGEGRFHIDIQDGGFGDRFRVERSRDMLLWLPVGVRVKIDDSLIRFIGNSPPNNEPVFYRVVRDL